MSAFVESGRIHQGVPSAPLGEAVPSDIAASFAFQRAPKLGRVLRELSDNERNGLLAEAAKIAAFSQIDGETQKLLAENGQAVTYIIDGQREILPLTMQLRPGVSSEKVGETVVGFQQAFSRFTREASLTTRQISLLETRAGGRKSDVKTQAEIKNCKRQLQGQEDRFREALEEVDGLIHLDVSSTVVAPAFSLRVGSARASQVAGGADDLRKSEGDFGPREENDPSGEEKRGKGGRRYKRVIRNSASFLLVVCLAVTSCAPKQDREVPVAAAEGLSVPELTERAATMAEATTTATEVAEPAQDDEPEPAQSAQQAPSFFFPVNLETTGDQAKQLVNQPLDIKERPAETAGQPFFTWRVRPGDTLSEIAQANGVSVERLYEAMERAQGHRRARELQVGAELTIEARPTRAPHVAMEIPRFQSAQRGNPVPIGVCYQTRGDSGKAKWESPSDIIAHSPAGFPNVTRIHNDLYLGSRFDLLKRGDEVILYRDESLTDRVITRVTRTEIVGSDEETSVWKQTGGDVFILATCYPEGDSSASERLIVWLKAVGE